MATPSIAHSGSSSPRVGSINSMVTLKPPLLTCAQLPKPLVNVTNYRELTGTAENTTFLMASQSGHASNGMYRFPQPMNSIRSHTRSSVPLAVPYFPLRNRTNLPTTSGSSNFLLQTILKDSQQVKAEYELYKTETQGKMQEQQENIRSLKENVNLYQKKLLEMKLQKEVYVARESHAFQEIQESIHNLLQRVSMFAQAESLKVNKTGQAALLSTLSSIPRNSPTDQGSNGHHIYYEELAEQLAELQTKISACETKGDDVLSTCKLTEETLRSYMAATNEKLDQIIFYIMESREPNSIPIVIEADADISAYNASAEDNQDSDAGEISTAAADHLLEETNPEVEIEVENNILFEIPTAPNEIVLNAGQKMISANNGEIRMKHRKRKSTYINKSSLRKRSLYKRRRQEVTLQYHSCEELQGNDDDGEDYDNPPVLTLPCRIAKDFNRRPQSMPILLPEDVRTEEKLPTTRREKVNEIRPQENKKDDALIGIKRENFSSGIHGRDFAKAGFICLCGAKFTGAGGLYVHQVKTMENEKFTCGFPECGKRYHYYSSLKAHKKHSHKQEFTQEVGCSRCGQVFKSKKDRQGHLDERGQTCWLSGSYQSPNWDAIRNKRNLSSSSYYSSSSASSSQNVASEENLVL